VYGRGVNRLADGSGKLPKLADHKGEKTPQSDQNDENIDRQMSITPYIV
jgi:hypothetical protein